MTDVARLLKTVQAANRLKEHARKALPTIQDAEKAKKLSDAIFAYMEARDGQEKSE